MARDKERPKISKKERKIIKVDLKFGLVESWHIQKSTRTTRTKRVLESSALHREGPRWPRSPFLIRSIERSQTQVENGEMDMKERETTTFPRWPWSRRNQAAHHSHYSFSWTRQNWCKIERNVSFRQSPFDMRPRQRHQPDKLKSLQVGWRRPGRHRQRFLEGYRKVESRVHITNISDYQPNPWRISVTCLYDTFFLFLFLYLSLVLVIATSRFPSRFRYHLHQLLGCFYVSRIVFFFRFPFIFYLSHLFSVRWRWRLQRQQQQQRRREENQMHRPYRFFSTLSSEQTKVCLDSLAVWAGNNARSTHARTDTRHVDTGRGKHKRTRKFNDEKTKIEKRNKK